MPLLLIAMHLLLVAVSDGSSSPCVLFSLCASCLCPPGVYQRHPKQGRGEYLRKWPVPSVPFVAVAVACARAAKRHGSIWSSNDFIVNSSLLFTPLTTGRDTVQYIVLKHCLIALLDDKSSMLRTVVPICRVKCEPRRHVWLSFSWFPQWCLLDLCPTTIQVMQLQRDAVWNSM